MFNRSISFIFFGTLLFLTIINSYEICGPRSCKANSFCISDKTAALCRPIDQAATLIEYNITADGVWTTSSQYSGSVKNLCNVKVRKVVFHADLKLIKPNSIWNAKYNPERNEIEVPDFADGLKVDAESYTFGFVLASTDTPEIKIKSIRF
ncbi:hypothetical protein CYY_007817 [Polysphondylium violaceum]|uniref:Carbohydrate binding domain-containing protein n=1 Tax=Polysphondylium violaceum TaxID=133409 RepID=A0A8J4UQM1_9MYCE|nr:hypothetical protein CYY_007817 [Polysphondylium violaceum]